MTPVRSAWRVLTAAISVGLALSACSTDIAVYDPTIQRGELLDDGQSFGSGTVVLEGGNTNRIAEDEPVLRNRIPGFDAPGFDPELAALPQLGTRQGGEVTMLGPETGARPRASNSLSRRSPTPRAPEWTTSAHLMPISFWTN